MGRTGMTVLAAAVSLAMVGCGAAEPVPTLDSARCTMWRLDEVADPAAFFSDPNVPCVIVFWDTKMDGVTVRPAGDIETSLALADAAREGGFAAPCETTLSPQRSTLERSWFASRFGALDPRAESWGVTLFVPTPMPDGVIPACAIVTPPSL